MITKDYASALGGLLLAPQIRKHFALLFHLFMSAR